MRTVELEPGEQYTCTLPGKASAGYTWEFSIEGTPDVIDIAEVFVSSQFSARQGSPPRPGYNADVHFSITARVSGEVIVSFRLRRLWETGKPPIDERVLHIVVRGR